WAVHRCRVLFLWRREPPAEIAFDSRARATPAPGFVQHRRIFSSHHPSTGHLDFLAGASSFHDSIQETRCSFCPKVLIDGLTAEVGTRTELLGIWVRLCGNLNSVPDFATSFSL